MKRVFVIFLLLLVIVVLLFGCATMQKEWIKAKSMNTIEVYELFLVRYPDKEFSDSARVKLRTLHFEKAKRINTFLETSVDYLSPLEKETFRELNLARSNPQVYASILENRRQYYDGNVIRIPGESPIRTKEGVSDRNEAVQLLKTVNPLPPFRLSKGMSRGAKDHVRDQCTKDTVQHRGTDGSMVDDRIIRYGSFNRTAGEIISHSTWKARLIIIAFIIDDGTENRGHREMILRPDFKVAGIACGRHIKYKNMTVITFVDEYIENE